MTPTEPASGERLAPLELPLPAALASGAGMRAIMYPLFFASGAAGLIYEVVWTRLLIYRFGAGLYAVTAVLSAFMAGLALGSMLIGRRGDRLKFPLRFYAMLEIAIGVAGFALPEALLKMDAIDAWAYANWGENFGLLTATRFVAAFAVMLVPTTLMGATLPVVSRALAAGRTKIGLPIGELYAVNTAGAVAGVFLAGFYLIERFGVIHTEWLAAVLNFAAAIGAYALSTVVEKDPGETRAPRDPAEADARPRPDAPTEAAPDHARQVLFAAFACGAIAMAAQVVWSRAIVFHFEYLKNTTYGFSAMLTVFLTGLALGSAVCGLFVDRHANPTRLYGLLLSLGGVAIAFSAFALHRGAGSALLPEELPDGADALIWPVAVGNVLAQSALVLAVPTFLMGMAFPAAVRAVVDPKRVSDLVARLYAVNTTGAILGPLVGCFVLIPVLGLTWSLIFLAALQAAIGVFLMDRSGRSAVGFAIGALVFAGVGGVAASLPRSGGMQPVMAGQKVVHYEEGPMATVAVVENNFGHRTIHIDGVGVAGTDPMLQTDQKSLAHVPTLLVENPKAALTVGFGSGGASYSFLRHSRLERVHCVEISREVPRAAPHLTAANHGLLEENDPRYRIVFDDARSYLQHTDEMYDVIATDCTDLRYKSNANLYDLQYFRFCRERLSPGGIVVVWMPLGGLSDEMFRLALRTFHAVFPEMAVLFMNNEPTHYILLLGWRDGIEIDFARMKERIAEPAVAADLAELNLDDPVKLLSTWILGGENVARYVGKGAINLELFPILEFASPKFGYSDEPIIANLASMRAEGNSVLDFVKPGTIDEADRERLARAEKAAPLIEKGHAHYRRLEIEEATLAYLEAAALVPEDRSLKALLEFPELQASARLGSPWAWQRLGRTLHLAGRRDEAIDCYTTAVATIRGVGGPRDDFEKDLVAQAEGWLAELRREPPPAP